MGDVGASNKSKTHENEQKSKTHENEQKSKTHENEQKSKTHENEQKSKTHENQQKSKTHENEQRRKTHENEQKSEKSYKKGHKRVKKKKKRHHKHHKASTPGNFDFPGIVSIVLIEDIQRQLHLFVGEDVTAETPWKKAKKEFIQEQVELEEPLEIYLPFVPYKHEIINFPEDEMLFGYKPDEAREYDEFYFCLTKAAEERAVAIIQREELKQQERIENTIHKMIYPWISLGSEQEITEDTSITTRGFYRMEFETRYPILNGKVFLKIRPVEEARDGYVELTVPQRYAIPFVSKRRVDNAIQVAPQVRTSEAQTNYGYPTNTWTQYEYICYFVSKITKEFIQIFRESMDKKIDWISEKVYVNSYINFYKTDYLDLIRDKKYTGTHLPTNIEYMSFKDIMRCKDQVIAAICWHPMWTGVVALAYGDTTPRWLHNHPKYYERTVYNVVHSYNPVLIWSFKDGLSPKLVLETLSEVQTLAFCPHDENLLVGGCVNGQIVLWDIKNKLNRVEEEEIITREQRRYRMLMFSLMNWMKNTKDLSLIPMTAISELNFSHLTNVTSISWCDPCYILNANGHYEAVPKDETSLQFYTSSSDGTIKFWNLKQRPVMIPGDYKPQRKSRRLGKRPSALTVDVSPYRILHRKMRPHYQLNVMLPNLSIQCPVSCVRMMKANIDYKLCSPSTKSFSLTERFYYKPVINRHGKMLTSEFFAGTYFGDFVNGTWEGYEYTSGDVVSKENTKVYNIGRYHDGPVLCVYEHPALPEVFLTVGGKVFAIWITSMRDKPVIWRRSRHRYTDGQWNLLNPGGLRINRSDGNTEIWCLDIRSDNFYDEFAISGRALLEGIAHPRKLDKHIIGLADDQGAFRLIIANNSAIKYQPPEFRRMLKNNAARFEDYNNWLNSWLNKHAELITQKLEAVEAELEKKREEELAKKHRREEEKARQAVEAAKMAAARLRPAPGHFEEWANEQWLLKEQERMGNILLVKRRLVKGTLVKQQMPLKKLQIAEERRRIRQRIRVQRSDKIFKDTVAMLFPDIARVKEKRKSTMSSGEYLEIKSEYFLLYQDFEEECDEFIYENPFIYKFSWDGILNENRLSKKKIDFSTTLMHSERYIPLGKYKRKHKKKGSINSSDNEDDEEDKESEDDLNQMEISEPME